MGTALYIVLEQNIPGLDTMVDGKALAQADEKLAMEAQRLGVRPLMEFFSADPEDISDFLEEGDEPPAEQWFLPEDGLKTIKSLISAADISPELMSAKADLLSFEKILHEAHKRGVKWHLAVDF